MKTKIDSKYKPREGYSIFRVLILNDGTISILNWKYGETAILDFYRNTYLIKSIKLEDIPGLDKENNHQCMVKYKDGFAFLNKTNKFIFWKDIDSLPVSVEISNPISLDEHQRFFHSKSGYYDGKSSELWFALEEPCKHGFPARFFCKLIITTNQFLGIGKIRHKAKWEELIELPLNAFPETYYSKLMKGEWLSINSFRCNKQKLYSYSVGGTTTRLKSGPNFEFSKIGVLDPINMSIQTNTVGEGLGIFAENSEYFILHPRKNKNKIYFYDIQGTQVKFDISLTKKQNLASEKKNCLLFDYNGHQLFIYNTNFLHVCSII